MNKTAVFFDRDDTLMRNVPYLGDPTQVRVLPGVIRALDQLRDAGFELFIVSNQSGVGRGLITTEQVIAVTAEMERQLGDSYFKGVYNCFAAPGQPGDAVRKPSPALLQQAAREHGLDLARSYMVGDRLSDVLCGKNAGCQSVLVLTGPQSPELEIAKNEADFIAPDMIAAAEWICSRKTPAR